MTELVTNTGFLRTGNLNNVFWSIEFMSKLMTDSGFLMTNIILMTKSPN